MSDSNVSLVTASPMNPAAGIVDQVLNSITKDDVVAIYVQEHTDELTLRKQEGEKKLRALDAEVQKLNAQLVQVGPRLMKTIDLKAAQKAAKAMTEAGFGRFDVTIAEASRD